MDLVRLDTGGSLIRELAQKSRGARIKVQSDRETEKEMENTIVTIEGSIHSQQDAAVLIFKELENFRSSARYRKRSYTPDRSSRYSSIHLGPQHDWYREERDNRYERDLRPERQERYERYERSDRSDRDSEGLNVQITVPDVLVSRLIGRNGDNVKSIMNKAGCNISFQQKSSEDLRMPDGAEARLCTFKGNSTAISTAVKLLVEQIIKQ